MRKVTITEDQILVEGFDSLQFVDPGLSSHKLGTCRDVGRAAVAWALRKLAEDVEKDMRGDWEKQITVVD